MYLKKVSLRNYKGIECLDIKLSPGINILIGDNGAGKTSMLDGMAIALGGLFVNVEGVTRKNIAKEDVHVRVENIGDNSRSVSYSEPVSAGCVLVTEDREYFWNRTREQLSSSRTKTDNHDICGWMKKLVNTPESRLPLISYQSAARIWQIKRGDFGNELKRKLDDRRCGYIGCLDSATDVKAIQQWCLAQEIAMVNKG